MLVCYAVTCVIAYMFRGDSVASFLPDAISSKPVRTLVGLLLAYHITIAYLLTNQPLGSSLHMILRPKTVNDMVSWRSRIHWGTINVAVLGLAFLVANVIPFFGDLQV